MTTGHLYSQQYFEGGKSRSNYDSYVQQSRGPSELLALTLADFFRPQTVLDVGCAVGHTVKKMRNLGVDAHGIDISSWAVGEARSQYVTEMDFSASPIAQRYDLVYSYDVIEHVMPDRLDYAIRNLWQATSQHLLVVPAVYYHGETHDPGEPTHMIFKNYCGWLRAFEAVGCAYDMEATMLFNRQEHTRTFNYAGRVLVFTR